MPDESRAAADAARWRRQRTEAAEQQQRALDRRRAQETTAARELISTFVAQARERGLAPEPLRARAFDGSATYRTPVSGWYLRRNRSVAVGTDEEFYVLSVPGGLAARLRGAALTPSDPPLVLGKGGRDGESIDLADALALVLDGA
ncbi:hypothetical protein [Cellulosimicrobium marinum]|uniref:hypothetical protein n=1 Tax=Cellulosimicrobium marinum TaxID=1638992 RepID=UPI001E62A5C9|nr:hypothetical protein [Cellulosimicrobium marinum]MCB7138036.1 hypothetical protein [Cellulosimicrobium marinum]